MRAFKEIGATHQAGIDVVGPGIAEALITTAAGLAAAIPALIAYNAYVNQIKEFSAGTDEFALEFLNRAEATAAAGNRPVPQMAGKPAL